MDDEASLSGEEGLVLIRVHVPELNIQKCLQFNRDELIWDVKQQCLAALPKELKESFNYGLFCPPVNGKAGKFLDEERRLSDYPFNGPIGYLELKYKRRVYKMLNLDEKQLKALHNRANLRRFLDFIHAGQVEKITKMCNKGLDPNFHCQETGETPLTIAATIKKPGKVLMALVNGGALIDYRTKCGSTAMHRATEKNNYEAVKTLLDLGGSPNYKDGKGLTPLYYSVICNTDPMLCEALLHDHASIGSQDQQGWHEIHQASRNGLVQHLEHLLFYGADMNSRNASGNTSLHVCAVNNGESCARVLLFRGCEKDALNYANQTPYQMAVIAGNLELSEVILNHRPEDVVPFKEAPKYNPRRRTSGPPLARTHSDPRLESPLNTKPPSPSPSNRSLPPFSSASSLSETSTGSSSTCTQPSMEDSEDGGSAAGSASIVTDKSMDQSDIISDSSGVGTSNSGGSAGSYDATPTETSLILPGMMVVCLENYSSNQPGHLHISQGDIVEVTGSVDNSMLEGSIRGETGFFPLHCVQEVHLRNPETVRHSTSLMPPDPPLRVQGRREMSYRQFATTPRIKKTRYTDPRTVILHKGRKGFGFVLRGAKATSPLMELTPSEKCPALQYLDDVDPGGVADMAGLKKNDFLLAINGEDVTQASHEQVVNLIRRSGDLVAMTVVTVMPPGGATNKTTSTLPSRQYATLPRKVAGRSPCAPLPPRRDPKTTLSVGRTWARSMVAGLAEIEALDRSRTDYDSEGRSTKSSSVESITNKSATSQQKTASIRSRPSSSRITTKELEEMFARQGTVPTKEPVQPKSKVYASVAEMKRHKANKQKNITELTKLHKDYHSSPDLKAENIPVEDKIPKVEHRRSHSQEDINVLQLNARNSRHSWACMPNNVNRLINAIESNFEYHNSWRSIEELCDGAPKNGMENGEESEPSTPVVESGGIYAQSVVFRDDSAVHVGEYRILKGSQLQPSCTQSLPRHGCGPSHPPPPTHPPPPPPIGQVVKVDVSHAKGEYANIELPSPTKPETSPSVMSSFRPDDNAKLYASPEEIKAVGYRTPKPVETQTLNRKTSNRRSHSLPPRSSRPNVQKSSASSDTASVTSDTVSLTYSTFKSPVSKEKPPKPKPSSGASAPSTPKTVPNNPYAQPFHGRTKQEFLGDDNYRKLKSDSKGPMIPEPDYDMSDTETTTTDTEHEEECAVHVEAKKAISEAKDRLKTVKCTKVKKLDSKSSVVFVSSVDVENNVSVQRRDPNLKLDIPKAFSEKVYAGTNPKSPSDKSSSNDEPRTPLSPQFKDMLAQKVAERNGRTNEKCDTIQPSPKLGQKIAIYPGTQKNGKIRIEIKQSPKVSKKTEKLPRESKCFTKSESFSVEEIQKVKTSLKSSRSYPTDFLLEDGDNSSSGVSSDQDVQGDGSYITFLPVDDKKSSLPPPNASDDTGTHDFNDGGSETSDSSEDLSDKTWILKSENNSESDKVTLKKEETEKIVSSRRTGMLTKNAVSLVQLPPPLETGETDVESDTMDSAVTNKSKKDSCEYDVLSTVLPVNTASVASSISDKEQPSSSLTCAESAAVCRSKSTNVDTGETAEVERSIEESLELIRMHVDSLSEVNMLAGVVPPPPEFDEDAECLEASNERESIPGQEEEACVLAPPPGFCDTESDFESEEYCQQTHKMTIKFRMSKSTKASKPKTLDIPSLSTVKDKESPKSETPKGVNCNGSVRGEKAITTVRIVGAIPKNIQDNPETLRCSSVGSQVKSQSSTKSTLSGTPKSSPSETTNTKLKSLQREFRNKPLSEWTTQDTTNWLESLFMPEYKAKFKEWEIDGNKLTTMDNATLIDLGVKRVGHRLNMEKSLKRYMPPKY